MNFDIRFKNLNEFCEALSKICDFKNIEEPNHTEITSNESGDVNIFISDTFIARLNENEIKTLKDFENEG